ncbi:MAG: hypothetical protein JSW02_06085 [candidate division WOR-3 bacterium]|nr:MAG: hypothetical protein JSW02_06085 [candidate division WOR-3 bacterium]
MIKKILGIILLVVIATFIIIRLIPREEDRVKRDINAFKDAVEREDRASVIHFINPEFTDNHGSSSEAIIGTIDNLFEQFDSISVAMSGLKVKIDSSTASTIFASCSLGLKVFARHQGDRILLYGGVIKPASVTAHLKKHNSRYLVYQAVY